MDQQAATDLPASAAAQEQWVATKNGVEIGFV